MAEASVDRGAGLASFRRYTWWTLPGTAGIILVLVVARWLVDPAVPAQVRAVGAVALAVTVVADVILLSRRVALPARTSPTQHVGACPLADAARPTGWLLIGGAGATTLGGTMLAVQEYGLWAVAPSMMAAVIASYLPVRRRRALLAGAAVAAAFPGALVNLYADGGDRLLFAAAFPAGLTVFTAWVTLGPLWAWEIAGRLERARRLAAELAVKDERLRFAADLHDIQGHQLQVIALKSELAARLAEVEPARAAAQMTEVRQLATDALTETRALVQGYRRTSLEEEIANATRVLAAADIDARMQVDSAAGELSASCRHLLGLVMREATTNVLRHSRAAHAEVHYRVADGRAYLRVGNDGAAGPSAAPTAPAAPPATHATQADHASRTDHASHASRTDHASHASRTDHASHAARTDQTAGSGLVTLARRLAAAGGELTWRCGAGHFVVSAELPLAAPGESR